MADIGKEISQAIELLKSGEVVAVPTETVYGLAANAIDPAAVSKIFIAKERPKFDPLIVHVASLHQAKQYITSFPEKANVLAQKFWPGPLTLILEKREIIPDLVTAGLVTVGIRCPDHPLTLNLLHSLDFPLAAPSANPFGFVSPTTAAHVNDQLGNKIPYILDGGPCRVGLESTIVGFEKNQVVIYRRGGISQEAIEKMIGPARLQLQTSSNPIAPGQLESHYAPKKRFLLGDINKMRKENGDYRCGVLRFSKRGESEANEFVLSPNGSLVEAAQNLFHALRQLDQMDVDIILAEKVPDKGIGQAINDRLQRAAAK